MPKQDVIEAIEYEWNAFAILAEDFPEESRVLPGAIGHWNVHEALLHVAGWDNEVKLLVEKFEATGKKPEWDGLSGDVIDNSPAPGTSSSICSYASNASGKIAPV